MKIVIIGPFPPYRGGISHFTLVLAVELCKAGLEILCRSNRKQYPKLRYSGINEPLICPDFTDYINGNPKVVLIYDLDGVEIYDICER